MESEALPVAVIGAGPVGLAAAAHLIARGETPLVLEAGETVGASVRRWGHVRMFSPWRYNVDEVATGLLVDAGWTTPEPDRLPTGWELVNWYLEPLAALSQLAPLIRTRHRVLSVSRQGFDKMKTTGRAAAPFVLQVQDGEGAVQWILAKAVIDASGTYGSPNPLGASGLPITGEEAVTAQIFYGIPDVLGAHRARYAGRRVLVVGSGHSAFNALLDLVALREQDDATRISWAVRRADLRHLFGGEERDLLPARGDLGSRVRGLVQDGIIRLHTGLRIAELIETPEGVAVAGEDEQIGPFDEIVAATGFRPDLTVTRELRLALDPVVESPVALAELIDPNVHSCGSVPPHGAEQLKHPETGFYTVGMKSYGRAPTFLLLTGYEQVRSVVAAIVGDAEGAQAVKLQLPETGVCSANLAAPDGALNGNGELAVVGGGGAVCCGGGAPT